jgi:Sec-independent protein translocase protein TatA
MPVDLLLVLVVILVVVLMWRGPKTLPKLGEALGRGVKEAKTEAAKAQVEIQARASGEPMPPAEAPGAPPAGDAPVADPDRPA